MTKKNLLSTPAAAAELGITADQFRRIAKQRNIAPADDYPNPHHRSGPRCPLWSRQQLGRIRRTNAYRQTLDRKRPDPEAAQRKRFERYSRKYSTISEAFPDACQALFNLNRYAKWSQCRQQNREEIYDLKTEFIRLLCGQGYADRIGRHLAEREEKVCFKCDGTGAIWNGDICHRCVGSGIYQPAKTLVFIVFSFVVGGERYTWHQPEELVTWKYELTAGSADWSPVAEEKPLEMPTSRFAEAKDLLRYVITKGRPEVA